MQIIIISLALRVRDFFCLPGIGIVYVVYREWIGFDSSTLIEYHAVAAQRVDQVHSMIDTTAAGGERQLIGRDGIAAVHISRTASGGIGTIRIKCEYDGMSKGDSRVIRDGAIDGDGLPDAAIAPCTIQPRGIDRRYDDAAFAACCEAHQRYD